MTVSDGVDLLIWLGVLGVAQFGALRMAVRWGAATGELILGTVRQHRIDRWVRAAPIAMAVSVLLIASGLVLRMVSAR
jgi:hypothetical protein